MLKADTGASLPVKLPPVAKPAPKPTAPAPKPKPTASKPPPKITVPPPPPLTALPASVLAAAGITEAQYEAAAKAGDAAAAAAQVIIAGGTAKQAAEAAAAAGADQNTVTQIESLGDGPFADPTPDPTAFNGFEFDPFFPEGGDMESIANSPKILRGKAFVAATRKSCAAHDIDPLASFANAMAEGIGGGIGDGGEAFGPWQIHLEDGRMAQFDNQDTYSPIVQAWAWTENGIEYATRSMVAGGARGKHGHEAVYDIVYGFERPRDEAGAYKTRANNYDILKAKGSGADAYLAQLASLGPSLSNNPGTTTRTVAPTNVNPVTPTATKSAWKDLMSFLAKDVPFAANHTRTLSTDLTSVFK